MNSLNLTISLTVTKDTAADALINDEFKEAYKKFVRNIPLVLEAKLTAEILSITDLGLVTVEFSTEIGLPFLFSLDESPDLFSVMVTNGR